MAGHAATVTLAYLLDFTWLHYGLRCMVAQSTFAEQAASKRGYSEEHAIQWCVELAEALHALHTLGGVVHKVRRPHKFQHAWLDPYNCHWHPQTQAASHHNHACTLSSRAATVASWHGLSTGTH